MTNAHELAPPRQLHPVRKGNDMRRLLPDCHQLAARLDRLSGPGAAVVRSLACRPVAAVELFEQHERRVAAEVLREEGGAR